MSFDCERKRTPQEIVKALLMCSDEPCEECPFYEKDTPRGYSPCHDWLMHEQAAEYIQELIALKETLSAEPERKWIPVSERLPEEREWLGTKQFGTTKSDEVYVTFENPKGERFCKHLSFQNGKLSRFDQSTIDAFYPEAKLIAWMPLPESYKGE